MQDPSAEVPEAKLVSQKHVEGGDMKLGEDTALQAQKDDCPAFPPGPLAGESHPEEDVKQPVSNEMAVADVSTCAETAQERTKEDSKQPSNNEQIACDVSTHTPSQFRSNEVKEDVKEVKEDAEEVEEDVKEANKDAKEPLHHESLATDISTPTRVQRDEPHDCMDDTCADTMAEADFTVDNAEGSPGSPESSDDGLPPLDDYWSKMLNVSKVAEPIQTSKLAKPKAAAQGRGKGDQGWKGRDHMGNKGFVAGQVMMPMMQSPYMMGPRGPVPLAGKVGGGKGWKGMRPRKGSRVNAAHADDHIGDFVAWAKDPNTEDGSRARSRSPHRHQDSECLENFLSWARQDQETKAEVPEDDQAGESMNSFMAWAVGQGQGGDSEGAREERKHTDDDKHCSAAISGKEETKQESALESKRRRKNTEKTTDSDTNGDDE